MTCPSAKEWDLLAMDVFDSEEAEPLVAHARACPDCRAQYEQARRAHVDRVRMYEAFDREHDALRDQLVADLPASPPRRSGADGLVRGWHRLGECVMSLNTTAGRRAVAILAPAACILIAITIFITAGHESAFAAALEHIQQARTIVARITIPGGVEADGRNYEVSGKLHVSAEYGSRTEMSAEGVITQLQYTPLEGPTLIVTPQTKSYFELDLADLTPDEAASRTPSAWLEGLKDLEAEAARELDSRIVDDQVVIGFEVSGETLGFAKPADSEQVAGNMEIWVAEDSGLPVQMKITVPMPEPKGSMAVVIDEIGWDEPLDAELFEPAIDDYVKLDVKFSKPSEETLLFTLERIRDLTGGRYTSNLQTVIVMMAEIKKMITDEARAELHEMGQQGILQFGLEIASGSRYFMQLVREGREPEYFGASVTADDVDEVLLRWKLDDGQIRVIYGDLHVETLPAPK